MKLTPKVINAGVSELARYVQGEDDGGYAVANIYRAMRKASLMSGKIFFQSGQFSSTVKNPCSPLKKLP